MKTTVDKQAARNGSIIFLVSFFDEEPKAVTPNEATWTLTDRHGAVINTKTAVVINPIASSVFILLQGADLDFTIDEEGEQSVERFLGVEYVYDSDTYGSNIPDKAEVAFTVVDLTAV